MSVYDFISTDDKDFPNLLSPKKHSFDGRALNVFSCEEDLYELEIIKEQNDGYADISFYTKLPYIYTVDWRCTEKRCRQLLEHIKANAKKKHKYELHRIRLANARSANSFRRDIENGVNSVKKLSMPLQTGTDLTLSVLMDAFEQEVFLHITLYQQ